MYWSSVVCSSDLDRLHLIVCFGVWKAGRTLVPQTLGWRQRLAGSDEPFRSSGNELVRHVEDALFQLRLARLPLRTAELVDLAPIFLGAELGSTSRRKRVCPTRYISVVAVS